MATILIIDDDRWLRDLARDCLEAQGHSVAEAEDGESGIAHACGTAFDCVLLDVRLPRMHLDQVFAGLRAVRPALAILFFTGLERDMLDPALLAAPLTGYLRKPFSLAELATALGAIGLGPPPEGAYRVATP